jgi:hypothetical protein
VLLVLLIAALSLPPQSQTSQPAKIAEAKPQDAKTAEWKSVAFAIVRFNDEAPQSWNIYHTSKRGVLLVKLWKRYLLVNVADSQVFDIDPQTVRVQGASVEWSMADAPAEPLEITDWRVRDVGPVERIRFRLGKNPGHILEIQVPLLPGGKPAF